MSTKFMNGICVWGFLVLLVKENYMKMALLGVVLVCL